MRNKALIILLFIFLGCIFIRYRSEKIARLPLAYSSANLPITLVALQGESYLFEVTTGGLSHIRSSILQSLQKKELGMRKVTNIKRKLDLPEYLVPEIRLDTFIWHNFRTTAYTSSYCPDGAIDETSNPMVYPSGNIGGAILDQRSALFDFPSSKLYLTKTPFPLKKLGYDIATFCKVPIVNKLYHFIPVEIETDFGKKVLIIDTGSTYTYIRGKSSKEMIPKESQQFIMGGKDFGPFMMNEYELPLDFPYDGSLGMDFLKDKMLYIDRKKGFVYFN